MSDDSEHWQHAAVIPIREVSCQAKGCRTEKS
jgi:hypothetical protein